MLGAMQFPALPVDILAHLFIFHEGNAALSGVRHQHFLVVLGNEGTVGDAMIGVVN